MKVKGLDDREYNWKLSGSKHEVCSSFHKRARLLLERLFPCHQRLEEVAIPGSNRLTADFYIPGVKLLVEVHGQQHYDYVDYFHKDKLSHIQANHRDVRKRNFCELNDINYAELPYNESDEQWASRIHRAIGGTEGT